MRIDKLLRHLRFAKSRSLAQMLVDQGHIRHNGRRIERAHARIAAGDVLVIPLPAAVRVIEIVTLPGRRGPAAEAQSCYRVLDERSTLPIAANRHGQDSQEEKPQ